MLWMMTWLGDVVVAAVFKLLLFIKSILLSRQRLFLPHTCVHNRMLHMAQHILMLAGMAAMEVDEDVLHGGRW